MHVKYGEERTVHQERGWHGVTGQLIRDEDCTLLQDS